MNYFFVVHLIFECLSPDNIVRSCKNFSLSEHFYQLYRGSLCKMDKKPGVIPNKNPIHQVDFRNKVENGDDEQGK